MKKCKVLMPIGALGGGINETAFYNGMAMNPDVIAIDAGSTDSGPASLATGTYKYARVSVKSDLQISVVAARKAGIPLLIGSCVTCGVNATVDQTAEIVSEILAEEGLTAKIAKIYSGQESEVLKKKWDEGKIHALEGAPAITRATFDECDNIVAVMGAEPFIKALNNGADIVLAGRTTDTAIMAAVPLMMGCDAAASWHGAKTVECGAMCTEDNSAVGVFLEVDEAGFNIKTLLPAATCSPYSVSAHLLYENTDPYRLVEPSGTIVTNNAVYTQVDERTVRVTGTQFEHAKHYTMKLEGAAAAGYQNISIVGIANSEVLADPDAWIRKISEHVDNFIQKKKLFAAEDYSFNFKAYGYNAVIAGPVPDSIPKPREIGILFTVTAKTQEMATQIAKLFNPYLLHFPAVWTNQLPSFAFPFSPVDCPRGHTYEFKLYHVVEVDNPLELVAIEYIDGKELERGDR